MRGRRRYPGRVRANKNFNPRPHAGATSSSTAAFFKFIISIHAPMRGRLPVLILGASGSDFNPRPHAGATAYMVEIEGAPSISIHAPMRGRQNLKAARIKLAQISIHAPMRGRLCGFGDRQVVANFNPRPHAGATFSLFAVHVIRNGFQSTPPCGGDGQRAVHG